MYSVEEIKENYKSFSDSKIENIARNESKGLRKEILGILKNKIEKRNLDKRLITWVEAETNTLTDFEKKKVYEKIHRLNCPNCGSKHSNLRGHKFKTIISFIIFSNQIEKNRIFCNSCAKNKRVKSFLTTVIFGWWSIKGLFLTPYTIITEIIITLFTKGKSVIE